MPPVKIKANGKARDLELLIKVLGDSYYVTKTSQLIQHQEDDQAHIFLLLFEEGGSR